MSHEIFSENDMKKSNLIKLTKKNFTIESTAEKSSIKKHKGFGLLLVYVDWCQYCKDTKDLIMDLGKEFKQFDISLYIANHTNDRFLPFINSFPTLFFINKKGCLVKLENVNRELLAIFNAFIELISNDIEDLSVKKIIENSLYNNSKAIQLIDDDFEKVDHKIKIKSTSLNNCGILKAYASWCGHCQNSMNKVKYVADKVNNTTNNINIYVIEMSNSENNPLNSMVEGFPTYLYVDKNGFVNTMETDFMKKEIETHQLDTTQYDKLKHIMQFLTNQEDKLLI